MELKYNFWSVSLNKAENKLIRSVGQYKRYLKLSQFGETKDTYGMAHEIIINNKTYKVIPLCHP